MTEEFKCKSVGSRMGLYLLVIVILFQTCENRAHLNRIEDNVKIIETLVKK